MLRSILERHHLTAYAFADLAGLSKQAVSRVLSGQRITAPVAVALARGVAKVDPESDYADPAAWMYWQADAELADVTPAPTVKAPRLSRRLTPDEVARVKADPRSAVKVAAELGVTAQTVWRVRRA